MAVVGYLDGSSDDDCMGEQIINLCSWVTAYIGHMYMDSLSDVSNMSRLATWVAHQLLTHCPTKQVSYIGSSSHDDWMGDICRWLIGW